MRNMLILGASGQIAQWVVKGLAGQGDIRQTLLLLDPSKSSGTEPANASVVIGSVLEGLRRAQQLRWHRGGAVQHLQQPLRRGAYRGPEGQGDDP
ncbi:MAG: hypothetical protein ACRCYW_10800 [Aeromonas sp.]|uniref:hypothetical protein n=1 Tax=Aeromonas sp. TaxID=647 RepID=UPI003F34533F